MSTGRFVGDERVDRAIHWVLGALVLVVAGWFGTGVRDLTSAVAELRTEVRVLGVAQKRSERLEAALAAHAKAKGHPVTLERLGAIEKKLDKLDARRR